MDDSQGRGMLKVSVAAEPASLAGLRRVLTSFLTQYGLDGRRRHEALLVANELAANAIEHGSMSEDQLEITITVGPELLVIRVLDPARTSARPTRLEPDEWRESGRGMVIVEQLAGWSERLKDGRREVNAQLPLAPRPPAA